MVAYQREMATVAGAIAGGDLSQPVQPKSERDVLGSAFAAMSTGLHDLIAQVQHTASGLATTADELQVAADSTGHDARQVAATLEQVAQGAIAQSETSDRTSQAIHQ